MLKLILFILLFFSDSIDISYSQNTTNLECASENEFREDCRDDAIVTYTEYTYLILGAFPRTIVMPSCEDGGEFRCPLDSCNSEPDEEEAAVSEIE